MNSIVKASIRAAVSGPLLPPACPYCGCREEQSAARSADTGLHQTCPECRSLYGLDETIPRVDAARSPRYWQSRAHRIGAALGYRPRRILDVDCGRGEFLNAWPWTAQRDGIEAEPGPAAQALSHGLRVFTGRAYEAEICGQYDVVTWFQGPAEGEHPRAVLSKIAPWVDQGGLLAIGLPTVLLPKSGPPTNPFGLARSPSPAWIESHLETLGFLRVEELWTSGGFLAVGNDESRTWSAIRRLRAWFQDESPLTRFPRQPYYEALFRRR